MKLKNKVSIVTGAGQGIGKQIAIILAKEGSKVIINDCNVDLAEKVAKEISSLNLDAYPFTADVSNQMEVTEMINQVIEKYGVIDILINNAGIQTIKPFFQLQEDEWKRVMDVNLLGTFICSKAVSQYMINRNKGKIVNISTIHYDKPRVDKFHYDASKAGIAILTKEMALELAKYKINVNCIAPGAIDTPMNKEVLQSKEKTELVISKIPWGRMGKAEEVAKLALFLVSDDSEYITGSIINIDGGRSLV